MCIGKKNCVYLDSNTEEWDNRCTLTPFEWFEEQLDLFTNAVKLFREGERDEAISVIKSLRNEDMQQWYIEHAQVSGTIRKNITKVPRPKKIEKQNRDPLRMPNSKMEKYLFERDGYRCRYCERRIIDKTFLKNFIAQLDFDGFQKGKTNLLTHGLILICSPVIDHVIPHNIGGQTNETNLVTSCYPCNFGKADYTLEQLKNINPFEREPICDDWDGLSL